LNEETSALVNEVIYPLGFLRMISDGIAPPTWKYPHPVGFQQFFTGFIDSYSDDYIENDECLSPLLITRDQVKRNNTPMHNGQLVFYHAAHLKLFGFNL
jgi:hypothetical protein